MAFQFHVISDRRLVTGDLLRVARLAEEEHVDYFQLREKDLRMSELLDLALAIRRLLKRTKLIINGCPDVAVLAQADGVHLNQDSVPLRTLKSVYPGMAAGYSAHSEEEALEAERAGADYVFLSPIWNPVSKPATVSPLGLETLTACGKSCAVPVIALGGIDEERVDLVRAAGGAGVAGISYFLRKWKL